MVFYFEDKTAVRKVGKEDREDPRDDVRDLELDRVVGAKEG